VIDNPGVYSDMCRNAAAHALNSPSIQDQLDEVMWEKLSPKVLEAVNRKAPAAINAALPGLLALQQTDTINDIKQMVQDIKLNQEKTSGDIEELKSGQSTFSTEMDRIMTRLTNLEGHVLQSTTNFTTIAEGLRQQITSFSDRAFKADDPGSLIYKMNVANSRMADLSIKAAQVSATVVFFHILLILRHVGSQC
jgi:hypothetical protein